MYKVSAEELEQIINKLIKNADESTKPTAFVNGYYHALADLQEELKKFI